MDDMVQWFVIFHFDVEQLFYQCYWSNQHRYIFYLSFLLRKRNTFLKQRACLPAGRSANSTTRAWGSLG